MRVGPYELGEEIGAGGLGRVFRAASPRGEVVAIKLIPRTSAERDARFEREVRSQASLGAEFGFVPVLDAGLDERCAYLVMPLLPGGCLASRLRRGALPLAEAERLASALAVSLAAAHMRGVIHRDLKPANILFDGAGRCYIADLGLAKQLGEDSALSRTGEMRGTIGYMAPEQASNAKSAGPAADVFSWGAVVFEAVSGRRAFDGALPVEQLIQALSGGVAPLRSVCAEVSPGLAAAVDRALRPQPGDRPAHGAAVLELLQAAPSEPTAPTRRLRASYLAGALAALALVAAALSVLPGVDPARSTPAATAETRDSPETSPTAGLPGTSPSAQPPGDARALGALLAEWPEAAPLIPRAVYGDGVGSLGQPLLALGWDAGGNVVGVGRTSAATWTAETGVELSRVHLALPPLDPRAELVLDGERGQLWLASGSKLQRWDLRRGALLDELETSPERKRLALAPDGSYVALASRRLLAIWRAGARGLEDQRPLQSPFVPHLSVLSGGEIVVASDSLRVYRGEDAPEVAPLADPMNQLGALAGVGDALYLLDKGAHVQRWDLKPLRLRYRTTAGLPGTGPSGKAETERWLHATAETLSLGYTRGPTHAGRYLRLDPLSGASLRETSLADVELLAPGPREQLAAGGGGPAGRVRVVREGHGVSGQDRWGRGPPGDGALALKPSGEGAYTVGAEVQRWSPAGESSRLEGERGGVGRVFPAPEGDGYLCVTHDQSLEHWLDEESTPRRVWSRRTPGNPLGASPLGWVVPLAGGRAVGYSRQTQAKREGSTLTISGQREVLTLFGAGTEEHFEWLGAPPLRGIGLSRERVALITPDRYGVFSLRSCTWEHEIPFPGAPAPRAELSPDGRSFVRWPAGAKQNQLELWRFGEERAHATFTAPTDELTAGACALTERCLVWGAAGGLSVWDLSGESPAQINLPLAAQTPPELGANTRGEVWVGTARGQLVVLAPRPAR